MEEPAVFRDADVAQVARGHAGKVEGEVCIVLLHYGRPFSHFALDFVLFLAAHKRLTRLAVKGAGEYRLGFAGLVYDGSPGGGDPQVAQHVAAGAVFGGHERFFRGGLFYGVGFIVEEVARLRI